MKVTQLLTLALIPICASLTYFNFYATLGFFIGAAWGCTNLYLLKQLIETLLISAPNQGLKLLIFTFIKFPLLYGAGYGLLLIEPVSPWDLLIGFTAALVGTLGYIYWHNALSMKEI